MTTTCEQMSLQQIEDELAALAARVAAANGRMLELLGELDRRNNPGAGFISVAHWYSWRTGVDLPAAREHVRVARALRDLPETATAVKEGQLAYSKARAITRVANPGNEAMLLEWAKEASTSQLERIVRGVRTARENKLEASLRIEARRSLTTYTDDDGMLQIRARLSPEEGALFQRALDQAIRDVWSETKPPTIRPADRATALARMCDRALHGKATTPSDRTQVVVHVDAEVLADRSRTDGRSALENGPSVSAETSRRLACDASVVIMSHGPDGAIVDVGRKKRRINAALRRAVHERDRHMCTFPGCDRRILDSHHLEHWIDGGETVRDNLASLCRRHHVFVHEQGYRVEMIDGRPRYFSPHGHEVEHSPPPPISPSPLDPVSGEARSLQATWDGIGHIDYEDAIDQADAPGHPDSPDPPDPPDRPDDPDGRPDN